VEESCRRLNQAERMAGERQGQTEWNGHGWKAEGRPGSRHIG
jgi:hypothetical protein